MRFSKLFGLAVALSLAFLAYGTGTHADNPLNADAVATVADPLDITQTNSGLDFGNFAAGTGGTVVINYLTDARSVTGDVTELGGTPHRAAFNVTGDPNSTYNIQVNGGPFTLTHTNTVDQMTLTITPGTHFDNLDRTIGGGGSDSFNIGGELTVGSGQEPGSYSGTFPVTAVYP